MKILRTYTPIFLFLILFSIGSVNAQAQIVENGGFETGDFTGWEVIRLAEGGDWFVYSGNNVNGDPVLSPPVGIFAASTQQSDPSSQVLFQDLELPNVNSIQCSVIYYYVTSAEEFLSPPTFSLEPDNQQARIDITDPDSNPANATEGVLENLFQTQPGDPFEVGYTTLNFDLSEYAGTTVRFRAAEVDNFGEFNFSIDNLVCGEDIISTAIPTLSQWGLIAMALAMAIAAVLVIRKRRFELN